jgi:hypothetical protein
MFILFVIFAEVKIYSGRNSDSLPTGRPGDRIPLWNSIFMAIHIGPEAHPTFCTDGAGYFMGI